MLTTIVLAEIIKQLGVAVPSIILGTQTITAMLHGIFDIKSAKVNHAISWIVAILIGLGFVAFNGLTFVTAPVWLNYVLGGVAGLFAGAAANGFYDWEPIWKIFNSLTDIFRKKPEDKIEYIEGDAQELDEEIEEDEE